MASGSRNLAPLATKPASSGSALKKPRVAVLNWWGMADLEQSYCADMLFYLIERAEEEGVDLEMLGAGTGPVGSVLPFPPLEQVLAEKFDGLILNSIWEEPYIGDLHKSGVPMVSVDFQPRGSPIDAVTFSGQQGGKLAAKAFIASGQRSIMVVTRFRKDLAVPKGADPWVEDDTAGDRRMGLQSALAGSAIELWPLVPWMGNDVNEMVLAHERVKRILAQAGGPPSVVFATDSDIANAMQVTLRELGYRVPEDIGMLTFDTTTQIEHSSVSRFNYVSYDWREMGRHGWELLMKRMKSPENRRAPSQHIQLDGKYVEHGSLPPRAR